MATSITYLISYASSEAISIYYNAVQVIYPYIKITNKHSKQMVQRHHQGTMTSPKHTWHANLTVSEGKEENI